ncbi:patatin [Gigaspora margarita]|uniref:Patatin n=1 Tax=Gigaspora margarita TaxID=4874 RepID=A0A8H4ARS4_GIGMA|nr:patatin [Gigaspora margarita]
MKAQDILGKTVIEPIRKAFENLYETPKTFESYKKLIDCENSLCESLNVIIDEELIVLVKLNNEDNGQLNQTEIKQKMEKVRNCLIVLKDLKEFANNLASQTVYSKRLDFIHNTLNSSNKKAILFSNILFIEEKINKHYRELAFCFYPDRTKYSNTPNGLHINNQYLSIELFRIILEIKEALLMDLAKASKNQEVLTFYEKNANKNFNIANDYCKTYKNNGNKLKILKREDIKEISSRELEHLSHSQYISQEDLIEAKKIFDKVKGTSQFNTNIELKDNLGNSQALVKVVNEEMSFLEKNTIQKLINNNLKKLSTELMFKPDHQIVSYQASQEDILHSNKQSIGHKIVGAILLTVAAIGTLKQDTMLLSEQEIHQKLNEIIKNALNAYNEGNYQTFFDLLCGEYKMGASLIKLKDSNIIDPEYIIVSLLRHGFRSDGITYLLNLIGKVLSSNKIKILDSDISSDELSIKGKTAFRGALNKKLVKEAEVLDACVHKL